METPKTSKVSKAKRRANDKWDKANMSILACKIKKHEAAAFREYAAQNGKTINSLFREYVLKCIQDNG